MCYVVDTHPLYWSLFAVQHLSEQAMAIFTQVGEGNATLYVPAVVVTELMLVIERSYPASRYADCIDLLRTLQASGNYLFLPLMPETVVSTHLLTDLPDVFDRLVVAEARRLRKPLITCDKAIIHSGLVDVVW